MASLLSQLSPAVVTAVAVSSVVVYWYMRIPTRNVVSRQSGNLVLSPKPSSIDEYKRDFDRFKRFGGVDGWKIEMDPKLNDFKTAYCLSTSFGMDVLLALGMNPPVIHQPLFVVSSDTVNDLSLSFFGFIGTPRASFPRPDQKFSNKILRVRVDGFDQDSVKVFYEIITYRDGQGPDSIRECCCF